VPFLFATKFLLSQPKPDLNIDIWKTLKPNQLLLTIPISIFQVCFESKPLIKKATTK
jgi:hypothetical protein